MISKNNRQNSNFQIAYFLAGSCHTPDAAYSLLCDQLDDREAALDNVLVQDLKNQAKIARADAVIENPESSKGDILDAQADKLELELGQSRLQKNIDAARDEVAFIKACMDKLEPLRKFAHLPLAEAHQAMQQEEWKQELIDRAENFLITQGSIPTDHFQTMRMHPEFETGISPAIAYMRESIASGQICLPVRNSGFNLPQLLQLTSDK